MAAFTLLVPSALFLLSLLTISSCFTDEYYVAAVYEHARQDNFSTPQEVIQTNLAFYREAAEVAKSKGADIIVFPEYGIFPPGDREKLKNYLENTPDPKKVRENPCAEPESYSNRPILLSLSCMAKNLSIVVVVNTGDIQKCEEGDGCPKDGDLHYNTNVAFDSDGAIIGRYHKEHLFFEAGMDLPRTPHDPTFTTDFGKFAMFVCFDVVFKKITDIAKEVDAVLLPTMWIDPTPLMTSVQLWNSFAFTNNVTFMAANIQLPGYFAVGSGIFNAEHRIAAYTYNTDGKSKLVVAKIPRLPSVSGSNPEWGITEITNNGYKVYDNDGDKVPAECSRKILNETTNPFTDYRCLEENTVNYTFVKLLKPKDILHACNNGVCCSLDYEAIDMEENYYLGVYNGTYNMFDRYFWCEQNCILVRCEAFGNNSCATFPMRSSTRFMRVILSANITSEYIYPSVLASGIRLARYGDWDFYYNNTKPTVEFNGSSKLLVVGLNSRCYDKDPPYVR